MMTAVRTLAWLLVACNGVAATMLLFSRAGGDAATRGIGRGLAGFVAMVALGVALLLLWEGCLGGPTFVVPVGMLIALAPLTLLGLFLSKRGLALLYPSLRDRTPRGPVVRYEFPDAATRAVAMTIVMQDYAQLETLLRDAPPNFNARDELGHTVLSLAIANAIAHGASAKGLTPLRLVLAAGARPIAEQLEPGQHLFARLATLDGPQVATALDLLLPAGLATALVDDDGRPLLFSDRLAPHGARRLLANGVDRTARDPDPHHPDWSAVTRAASNGNFETALVLLQGGVPRDHASPPGSALTAALEDAPSYCCNTPAHGAFLAAIARNGTSPR